MPLLAHARAPQGLRLYAIGDVHGRLDLLRDMHARIAADLVRRPPRAFRVIHCGDYVDRGPDSAGVIDHLIEFARDGDACCLAGNHDLYVAGFLEEPDEIGPMWLANGGDAALTSWGVDWLGRPLRRVRDDLARRIPDAHLRFLTCLPFTERHGDFLFVHAGLRPGAPLEKQAVADLTFIRRPFLEHDGDFGAVVVHGHTPTRAPQVRRNRIGIDTAAYATGRLTCLVLEADEKGFLEAGGYAPLPATALPA